MFFFSPIGLQTRQQNRKTCVNLTLDVRIHCHRSTRNNSFRLGQASTQLSSNDKIRLSSTFHGAPDEFEESVWRMVRAETGLDLERMRL